MPDSKQNEASIMELIYNKVNEMIGAGNQLFSMQFPAQPLNPNLYTYDTSDRNSIMTRPFTVAEQEFRLSDQLFDVSPITAGSNGEKLSVVYNTLLNNMIPKLDYLIPFIKDRAGLGHWLLEETDEVDENGQFYSRIELCKKLYNEYLVAKNSWNEEKTAQFESLRNKPGGMDEYAKWQSSYGMVKTEELNNLYNDVVVTGHLHEVLTILGYLNASSIAEELEVSKQKMRNSVRLSLDESLSIYPVQMSPNNWFKALSPNLNPEDLTMAKDSIRDIYRDKQKELLRAKGDLQKAELMNATQEDIDVAQQAVDSAKRDVSNAENALIKQYGEGIVGVAKIYFNTFADRSGVVGKVNKSKAESMGAEKNQKYIDALQQAVDGIAKTHGAQQKLTEAIGNLTSLSSRKAQLESKEWAFNREALRQRVNELETDVKYYGDLLSGVTRAAMESSRIYVTKKSFTLVDVANKKGDLICECGFSEVITGGTFVLKIGSSSTAPIAIPAPTFDAEKTVDFGDLGTKIGSAIAAVWQDSTSEAISGSPGYYTLTFKNIEDGDVFVDEKLVTPGVGDKSPSLLVSPKTLEEAEIAGMFTDITMNITDEFSKQEQASSSSASASSWGVSLWFASASGSSSSSSASASQKAVFTNQEIEIGFRVAKVSFDRGGWFNPQIFKMCDAFTKLADIKTSPGKTVDDIRDFLKSGKGHLDTLFKYANKAGKTTSYVLPAFPVAMAIAKDITIKISTKNSSSESMKSVVENARASSGGFLCFSVSSSSSSKSSSEMAMSGSHGEHYYIRIPGPQVLGYFLQMMPEDTTCLYEPVLQSDGTSKVLDAFRLYDSASALLKSAAGKKAIAEHVDEEKVIRI